MNALEPWLETLAVALVAALGAVGGYVSSRLRKPWWLSGYLVPLALVSLVALGRIFDSLSFVPPCSWLLVGRARFAILGAACAMLLVTPLSRLSSRRQRRFVGLFAVVIVCCYSILPFLLPAVLHSHLLSLETRVDADGVCLQSTDYTCGPAAAVTALRRLGLSAEEGELAVLCHTTPTSGTPPDLLCEALEERYGAQGLTCRFRRFEDLDELAAEKGVVIAVIKHSFLVDHYVVVLAVKEDRVDLGDPSTGRGSVTRRRFHRLWRFSGVVLERESP